MRKGEIKRIRDIVISIDAPLDHNVGWVDASDIRYPKLKWYVNGEWDTIQPIDIQQELFEYLPKFNIQNQKETKDACEILGDKSLPIIGYEDNDDSLYFGVLKSQDSQYAVFNYIRLYSNNPNTSKRDTLGAIRIDKSNGVITQVKNLSILTSDLLGVQNGVASLDGSGKVPSTQLPSYVDDVIEVATYSDLPQPGESGKIYVVTSTNATYRWSGSTYVKISEYVPVELGSGTNSVQQKGTGAVASGPLSVAEGGDNLQGGEPISDEEKLHSKAEGYASHAEGAANAIGPYSHAEGGGNSVVDGYKTVPTAEGAYSHAEGSHTYAKGSRSHAEGLLTQALGDGSHVEGYKTIGRNANDHAEGLETVAEGWGSHAEGELSEASSARSHAEGYNTKTGGSDTTNSRTTGAVVGGYSHAEGNASIANGQAAHAEGTNTLASNHSSHAEGSKTIASGPQAHAEGIDTQATANRAHAEGNGSIASGENSHAEGSGTTASSNGAHSEGNNTTASGLQAHAEGLSTIASGARSHAEGNGSKATGSFSHAENRTTIAQGHSSHAEGMQTVAGTDAKQASNSNETDGYFTHAEGNGTRAYGNSSHAEGKDTQANGLASHAEGESTITNNLSEHAEGRYNKSNKSSDTFGGAGNTQHSVGIGTATNNRKNAIEIMQNGDAYLFRIGEYDGTNPSTASTIKQVIDGKASKNGDVNENFSAKNAFADTVTIHNPNASVGNPTAVVEFKGQNDVNLELPKEDGKFSLTPDWNAPQGSDRHILNRTHYEETSTFVTDNISVSQMSGAPDYILSEAFINTVLQDAGLTAAEINQFFADAAIAGSSGYTPSGMSVKMYDANDVEVPGFDIKFFNTSNIKIVKLIPPQSQSYLFGGYAIINYEKNVVVKLNKKYLPSDVAYQDENVQFREVIAESVNAQGIDGQYVSGDNVIVKDSNTQTSSQSGYTHAKIVFTANGQDQSDYEEFHLPEEGGTIALTSQVQNRVIGDGITKIKSLTQAQYDALATKDSQTFYVIV